MSHKVARVDVGHVYGNNSNRSQEGGLSASSPVVSVRLQLFQGQGSSEGVVLSLSVDPSSDLQELDNFPRQLDALACPDPVPVPPQGMGTRLRRKFAPTDVQWDGW